MSKQRKQSQASKLLVAWLTEKGHPHSWLSDQLPVSRPAVTQWLLGDNLPLYEYRLEIEKLTGIPAWAWKQYE